MHKLAERAPLGRDGNGRTRRTTAVLVGVLFLTSGGMIVLVPGGLFELLLPLWLFARGFSAPGGPRDA